jgi:hypothetical protein
MKNFDKIEIKEDLKRLLKVIAFFYIVIYIINCIDRIFI